MQNIEGQLVQTIDGVEIYLSCTNSIFCRDTATDRVFVPELRFGGVRFNTPFKVSDACFKLLSRMLAKQLNFRRAHREEYQDEVVYA